MLAKNILREYFTQSLHPRRDYKKHPSACILGFDTEYDSKTNELVCYQLSYQGYAKLFLPPLNWDALYQSIAQILRERDMGHSRRKFRSFILATYFSIAEAQHLNILDISVRIDEWGNGNYDFTKSYPSKNQTVRICDIQQWFRGMGLAKVAPYFGVKKLEYDVENVTKACLAEPHFIDYAKNDAVITEHILIELRKRYLDKFNVDIIRTKTPANTSAIIFLKDYLKEHIEQPDIKLRRLTLLCSWGGNNQSFVRGVKNGKFKMYDANSMYPNSCIRLGLLPRKQDWCKTGSLMEFLSSSNKGGICKVGFRFADDCNYPCLPVYSQQLRALVYPLAGVSYCTLAEVRLAKRMGAKLTLYQAYYYREGIDYLAKFLADMLLLKQQASVEGNEPAVQMYKLNMNSIIGKFTQKTVKRDINDLIKYSHEQGIPLDHLVTFRNMPVSKRVNLGSIFYPEWNTLILGYARATIAEAFAKYDALIGTTDSFVTEQAVPSRVKVNGIWFDLKLKADYLIALRTRVYCLYQTKELKYKAHHGIHNRQQAESVIAKAVNKEVDGYVKDRPFISYEAKHIIKLREAILHHKKLGQSLIDDKRFFANWDNKRIEGEFYTRPLLAIPERLSAIQQQRP